MVGAVRRVRLKPAGSTPRSIALRSFLASSRAASADQRGERADGIAALLTSETVVNEEGLAAAWIGSDAEPCRLGIVIPPHCGAGELDDELVRQPHRMLRF